MQAIKSEVIPFQVCKKFYYFVTKYSLILKLSEPLCSKCLSCKVSFTTKALRTFRITKQLFFRANHFFWPDNFIKFF